MTCFGTDGATSHNSQIEWVTRQPLLLFVCFWNSSWNSVRGSPNFTFGCFLGPSLGDSVGVSGEETAARQATSVMMRRHAQGRHCSATSIARTAEATRSRTSARPSVWRQARLKKRVCPHLLPVTAFSRHQSPICFTADSLLAIKEQLGHAFAETTMIYVHSRPEHTRMQYRM